MASVASDPDSAEPARAAGGARLRAGGADARGLANARSVLAGALIKQGRFSDAATAAVMAADSSAAGSDAAVRAVGLNLLAQTMAARGRLAAAESVYAAARVIDSAEFGTHYSESVYDLADLGRVVAYRGDLVHGAAILRDALRDLESDGGGGGEAGRGLPLESVLQSLAVVAVRRGDWASAVAALQRVLRSSAIRFGSSDDVRRLAALGALSVALRSAGRVRAADSVTAEAARVFARGVATFVGAPVADSTVSALHELCGAGAVLDRPTVAVAVAVCDRAVAIAPEGGRCRRSFGSGAG